MSWLHRKPVSAARLPVLVLLFVGVARGDSVLDQVNGPYGFVGPSPAGVTALNGEQFQQQVTDGIDGVLAGVELWSVSPCLAPASYCDDTVTVSIGLGTAFFSGSYAFTTTATITPTGFVVDTSSADIYLTPGETFVIDISNQQPGPYYPVFNSYITESVVVVETYGTLIGGGTFSTGNPTYPGGDLVASTGIDFTTAYGETLQFETFISPAPEPGTLALLSGGLLWLGLRKRFGQ